MQTYDALTQTERTDKSNMLRRDRVGQKVEDIKERDGAGWKRNTKEGFKIKWNDKGIEMQREQEAVRLSKRGDTKETREETRKETVKETYKETQKEKISEARRERLRQDVAVAHSLTCLHTCI